MSAKSGVGGKFEDDIASLFRLAGYSIEQNVDYGGQEFDIIATKDEIGKLKSRIAIECKFRKAGTVGNQDVFDFLNAFRACADSYGLTHGMIVSNAGFSRNAQVAAEKHGNISLMSAAALEHELLGASNYLQAAKHSYRSDFANYVVLRAEKVRERRRTKDSVPDAARYCAQRLRSATPSFTVLLGDFGSGKTTLAEQIHAQLAVAFLAEESDVFPLILYLRTLEQHDSETGFIESHLKLSSKDFTVDRLEAVRKRNRIALILDGFDEVATNASEEERMRLFSRAMRVAARGHSVLLTSRPSYFNNLDELEGLMQTLVDRDYAAAHALDGQVLRRDRPAETILEKHQAIAMRRLGQASFPRFDDSQTEMLMVSPLTKADIIKFFEPFADELKRRHRKTPEQVYDFLAGIYDLTDLLTRPLLLDMFAELLRAGELDLDQPDMQVGPAGLYHLYINYHLSRDWGVRRFLLPEERLAFAQAAAIAMLEAGGSLEATYESVWKIVRDDATVLAPGRQHLLQSNREGVVTDVRVCSFMNVTSAGRIEFSHKSFMEYFVADVIVKRLGERKPIKLLGRPLNYEILYFLGSYALVRSEVRLEIVQHLQHVAYDQPAAYRSNLRVALMFSEQSSIDREFADIEFSRIRIARKGFQACRFRGVTLHHATLLNSRFAACEFESLRIEGELHGVVLDFSSGTLELPASCERLTIKECPSLRLDSAADGVIRIVGGEWNDSEIALAANLEMSSMVVRATTLSFASGKAARLAASTLRDTALRHMPQSSDPRRLPALDLDRVRLTNVAVAFVSITREQFVDAERMLRNLRGILVVDDPDRKLQAFWEKDKAGVTRYLGWEANPHLLLLSADSFAQLRPQALASIERTLPTGRDFGRWTVDLAASTLRSELGRPAKNASGSGA